ncbi:MAG: hypothetical protein EHM80_16335 [Nitrospiraceae bacterium]|nr:MAG: hypothetical protein EHM80_16335 [Nitrospiraceae bacterium]
MNTGFRHLAAGAFEQGLAQLDADPEWHDDRLDLEGPFRLGFPRAQGWGEELLVASLLKRHADASEAAVRVFASEQVFSILKRDPAFLPQLCEGDETGRPPLAILRHALMGKLLNEPFVPLASPGATTPSSINRRPRVGIAWASVSGSGPIAEKSVPVDQFLTALADIDADLISLQRMLAIADPRGLARKRGVHLIEDQVLDAATPSFVEALVDSIRGLDFLVTISTTTTHIAAALGIRVELIVAEREGQQWFWRVQASHGKHIYPTVKVHLGDGRKEDWWERALQSIRASLSRKEHGSAGR